MSPHETKLISTSGSRGTEIHVDTGEETLTFWPQLQMRISAVTETAENLKEVLGNSQGD